MSFLTQRFANSFPLRSSIRTDQSSYGQKLFSCFSDLAESTMVDIIKMTSSFTLEKEEVHVGTLYKVVLSEEDKFRQDENNQMFFVFPTVEGITNTGRKITLKRVSDSENFMYGVPNRIEEFKRYPASGNYAYANDRNNISPYYHEGDLPVWDRLVIGINDSTLFKSTLTPLVDRPFNGISFIKIKGKDKFLNKIEEYITVTSDGEYKTKKVFRRIDNVEFDGFDGKIEIRVGESILRDILTVRKRNKFKTVSNILRSGICEIQVSKESIEFDSGTEEVWYLDVYGRFIIDESLVKRGAPFEEDLIRSKIAGMVLLDSEFNFITPKDFFISEIDSRLYVLDSQNRVHIYDLYLSPFIEKGDKRTAGVPIISKLLTQRVPYGKDVRAQCELKNNIGVVKSWEIKLLSPEGNIYFLKYSYDQVTMKSSLTWLDSKQFNITSYINPPLVDSSRTASGISELNWRDFSYKMNCDEIGQWDLFTKIKYVGGTEYLHKTSFICESLVPLKSFQVENNSKGIFMNESNNLCVRVLGSIVEYKQHYDCYLADISGNRIITRDEYKEIEVTYE